MKITYGTGSGLSDFCEAAFDRAEVGRELLENGDKAPDLIIENQNNFIF
jgi:hypothetical protein